MQLVETRAQTWDESRPHAVEATNSEESSDDSCRVITNRPLVLRVGQWTDSSDSMMGEASSTSGRCDVVSNQPSPNRARKMRFGNQHAYRKYYLTSSTAGARPSSRGLQVVAAADLATNPTTWW
ncbi:hypothetical protein AMTR_s00058p00115270 [Amborella trichopoda]|uniref:Uncharacterized protein n=1 Tax=Amborella trichopoda TaxID=13333 RepID=W1PFQ5_AMBTC|nr:hypothetical protein AMTR_s00058p00115270 [Amborella trichopoda]